MLKKLVFQILGMFFITYSTAQNASITITFSGIKEAKGQIMLALNNANGEMVEGFKIPVSKVGEINYTIKNVKPGTYTIAAFHDKNKDDKLNTNMLGLPTELYGFSNNARGTFGPPSLKDQSFEVKENTTLKITLK
jgi:uncharacterized protein (DUF2141 family)